MGLLNCESIATATRRSCGEKAEARFRSVDWSWKRYIRQFTTVLKEDVA